MKLPVKYEEISQAQRSLVRMKYIEEQKGLCWFCNLPLSDQPAGYVLTAPLDVSRFPKGFFKHPIHLHHDHDTGWTVGAVHNLCNAVMFQYEGK